MAPAMRQIAEFVLRDPERVRIMTITELASAASVADSTVSRFVREMGLDGYRSLRLGVAEATFVNRAGTGAAGQQYVYEGISRDEPADSIIGKVERSSQEALRQTALYASTRGDRGCGRADRAGEVIVFFAMGLSCVAAEAGVHAVHQGRQEVPAVPRPEHSGDVGDDPGQQRCGDRDQRLRRDDA